MAVVRTINTIEVNTGGTTAFGKHGKAGADPRTPLETTVTGNVHERIGSLSTLAGVDLWDSSNDAPSSFDKVHVWSSQESWLQVFKGDGSFVVKVSANDPFVLTSGDINDSFAATLLSGGNRPASTPVTRLYLWNDTVSSLDYHAIVVD